MKSGIITIVILVVILAAVGYLGLSVWSATCAGPASEMDMPSIKKATHEFYFENTGGLVLASDYEQHGQVVGKRLFVLHGYWEVKGKEFKFIDETIPLDEKIFGIITVKKRG